MAPSGITKAHARSFLDDLRSAVARAHADSEGYLEVVQAMERVGRHLRYLRDPRAPLKSATLSSLEKELSGVASCSSARIDRLSAIFRLMREGRNDAIHQGGAARQLTAWAIEYALALQEGFVDAMDPIHSEDLMIRNVIVAEPWQLVRDVRAAMLANSFSYIPVFVDGSWRLVSDVAIVRKLLAAPWEQRAHALNVPLEQEPSLMTDAVTVSPGVRRSDLSVTSEPLLVVDESDRLLGLIAAYDLL